MIGIRAVPPAADGDRDLVQIKLLIIENQEVIRRGLLDIVSAIPEVATKTVLCGGDPVPPGAFDVTLASASALEATAQAWGAIRRLRPLLVTVSTSQPRHMELAIKCPADGYVMLADLTPDSLRTALLQVAEGRIAIPGVMAEYLLSRARGCDAMMLSRLYQLSPREAEVLELLVAGHSNKEIASQLCISIHGVKRHVSMLLSQFHSPNRAHLVSYVLQSGVVAPTAP